MTADAGTAVRLGILCMIGGMFCISLNDVAIKSLAGGYPLHQLVFMRSAIAVAVTLFLVRAEGGLQVLNTGRWGLHAFRSLLVLAANSFFFAAISVIPLATATALYFVAPLFVTLLSIPVLGETVGPRRFAAIGVGFVGVMIMMGPQLIGDADGLGWLVMLPVLAALFYATMSVLTRKLGGTSRASALALHIHLSFLIFGAGMYFAVGDGRFAEGVENPALDFLLRAWVWPASTADWFVIAGVGVLSAAIGYLMSQAYRLASASVVAPFEYILLIFALFWGWSIFSEWPTSTVLLGAAIVMASGIYIFLREGRTGPQQVRPGA